MPRADHGLGKGRLCPRDSLCLRIIFFLLFLNFVIVWKFHPLGGISQYLSPSAEGKSEPSTVSSCPKLSLTNFIPLISGWKVLPTEEPATTPSAVSTAVGNRTMGNLTWGGNTTAYQPSVLVNVSNEGFSDQIIEDIDVAGETTSKSSVTVSPESNANTVPGVFQSSSVTPASESPTVTLSNEVRQIVSYINAVYRTKNLKGLPAPTPVLSPGLSSPPLTSGSAPTLVPQSSSILAAGSGPAPAPGAASTLAPGAASTLAPGPAPSLTPRTVAAVTPGSTVAMTPGTVFANRTSNQVHQRFRQVKYIQPLQSKSIPKIYTASSGGAAVVKPTDAVSTATAKPSPSVPTDIPARTLPVCDAANRTLHGRVNVQEHNITSSMLIQVAKRLEKGGRYKPPHCRSPTQVAIIMPYRDREYQLGAAMYHLHTILQRQLIEYQIFIVEQIDRHLFNRAMLFNVGYMEARRIAQFDCFIFSDVDLLPLDDRNIYNCGGSPKHMSAYVDKLDGEYKSNSHYFVRSIFGGVVALTNDHVRLVNGFSNLYFGWGGEDDDLLLRTLAKRLPIGRLIKPEFLKRGAAKVTNSSSITEHAHYHALDHAGHKKEEANSRRFTQLKSARQRIGYDGLNCLSPALDGNAPEIEYRPLFTLIRVTLDQKRTEKVTLSRQCLNKPIPVN